MLLRLTVADVVIAAVAGAVAVAVAAVVVVAKQRQPNCYHKNNQLAPKLLL